MLILALDANFKLKNRLRANERYDPSLGPGWGAFVEPTAYKEHLRNYVGENDVRIVFQECCIDDELTRDSHRLVPASLSRRCFKRTPGLRRACVRLASEDAYVLATNVCVQTGSVTYRKENGE